jgi:hypothetical protein
MTDKMQLHAIINQVDELLQLLDKYEKSPSHIYRHQVNEQKKKLKISVSMYRMTAAITEKKPKAKRQPFVNNSYRRLAK